MEKLKIVCICGYGMGSCMVLKWTAESVLKKHGIPNECITADMGTGKGLARSIADIVIMSGVQASVIGDLGKKVITIKNYQSEKEFEEKLIPVAKEIMESKQKRVPS